MGAVSQLLVFAVSFVIYLPFVLIYERQQNKQEALD
jgi:PTS system cellobiose-specific IIC component